MKRFTLNQKHRSNQTANLRLGFTIVEILIVIVVIGILATVTIVAYSGVQQNARNVSLQSDLSNADASLALAYTQTGTYPATQAIAGLAPSPGTTFLYTYRAADNSYCLTATNGGTSYVISTANPTPLPGVCPVVVLTAPTAPTNLAATGGVGQIFLTWTTPTDNGGSAITGYKLYRGTTANPTTLVQTLGNVTSYNDTGLVAGTTYYYRVTATNSIGDSPYSTQAITTTLVSSGNLTFTYTGGVQSWTVPGGVTSITTEVWGAQGGAPSQGGVAGLGGYAKGTLAVTPGESLNIQVGEQGKPASYSTGQVPGGYNGGGAGDPNSEAGAGGGGTDIRRGGSAFSNRVIVAGGGGGGGYNTADRVGGGGGYPNGANGAGYNGATGGTQTSGGIPGSSGLAGALGQGGYGAVYGGGGGGGYYGGGGGNQAGGGGGSSYIGGVTGGSTTTGTRSGNGQVIITW